MGLNAKKVDYDGNTLLHEAAPKYHAGKSEMVFIQYLLSCGIPASATNNKGLTPAHISMEATNVEYVGEVPLWKFFKSLDETFDVNIPDFDGVTLLHLACVRSEVEVIRLLDAGAKWNIVTAEGHPKLVYLLLAAGARVNQEDNRKRTPLHCCADYGKEQNIFSVVGDYNFNIKDRWRPYLTGFRKHYMQINRIGMVVTALLAAGADALTLDEDDTYPLAVALTSRYPEMARKLDFTLEAIKENEYLDFDPSILTQLALMKQPGVQSLDLKGSIRQDLLQNSARYLPLLHPQSIVD
ncbi:hypothetical protein ONS96_010062 [Cadophora gregata f. sp. sojae]|nr:hypothetical protein ONS96_010062 [Cadophora gregata f. sp. sojae]